MKKIIFIIFLFSIQVFQVLFNEPKLQEIVNGWDSPWSFSFISNSKVIITEKSGNLILVDLNNQKIKKINHNLDILEDGQGGLLEVLYFNEQVFVSYSENLKNGKSSTSVASAKFSEKDLNFTNIFKFKFFFIKWSSSNRSAWFTFSPVFGIWHKYMLIKI